MKTLVAAMVLVCALGCGAGYTVEEIGAASTVVAAHDQGHYVDPETLARAREIVEAGSSETDWGGVALSAVGLLLGLPLTGQRGRQVLVAGLSAVRRGDARSVVMAARAYAGASHSGVLLSRSEVTRQGEP